DIVLVSKALAEGLHYIGNETIGFLLLAKANQQPCPVGGDERNFQVLPAHGFTRFFQTLPISALGFLKVAGLFQGAGQKIKNYRLIEMRLRMECFDELICLLYFLGCVCKSALPDPPAENVQRAACGHSIGDEGFDERAAEQYGGLLELLLLLHHLLES